MMRIVSLKGRSALSSSLSTRLVRFCMCYYTIFMRQYAFIRRFLLPSCLLLLPIRPGFLFGLHFLHAHLTSLSRALTSQISQFPTEDPKNYVFGSRKAFLYEIVSNPRNSIDVDKFDYLNRDAYMCGVKINVDVRRLMTNCRVIDNQICYHEKVAFTVYQLFHSRYSMFKQVYSHRAVKAVEYMVRDALISANPTLDIVGRVVSADKYLSLDDRVLALIAAHPSSELDEARALLRRIDFRDIYRFTEEALIPESVHESHKNITAAQVLKYLPDGAHVTEKDVIVQNLVLNFAKKDKNPVDDVRFFKTWDDDESFPINRQQTSHLTPSLFLERYLRVFIKDNDEGKIAAVREAIATFVEKEFGSRLAKPAHGEFALTQERLKSPSRGGMALSRSSSALHGGSSAAASAARVRMAAAADAAAADAADAAAESGHGGRSSMAFPSIDALKSVRKTVSFSQAFSSQQSSQGTVPAGNEVKRARSAVGANDEHEGEGDDGDVVVDTVRVIPPSSQNSGHGQGFSSSQRSRGAAPAAKKEGQQNSLKSYFKRQ